MRAGAPSAPVLQQSRCCPTARFARGPHPALRATFSHAARGRRGKLQFAALNLAAYEGKQGVGRLRVYWRKVKASVSFSVRSYASFHPASSPTALLPHSLWLLRLLLRVALGYEAIELLLV